MIPGGMISSTRWSLSGAGIRAWLAGVTLLAAIPMLAVLLGVAAWQVERQREQDLARVQRQTVQAARDIGEALALRVSTLRTMALGPVAMAGDLPALHAYAARVAADDPLIASISLSDAAGVRHFSTRVPYGVALPPSAIQGGEGPVFEQRRVMVSPLVRGAASGQLLVGVAVPVADAQGTVRYALRAALRTDGLGAILQQLQIPPDWTVAVLDQRLTIIARSREAERFVGSPATESLQAFVRGGGKGVLEVTAKDGRQVMAAVSPIGDSGWTVALGLPVDRLESQGRRVLVVALTAGVIVALLGALASFALGRLVAAQVIGAARGDAPARGAPQELGRIHAKLDAARSDALTGLPGRAAFMERVDAMLSGADPDDAVAVLFMDLDGFKALNDTQGHEAGDRALIAVAEILRQQLRVDDLPGRLGGDEFVAALRAPRSTSVQVALGVAQRIVYGVGALSDGLGCSIGLAVSVHGEALPSLLDRADRAMYAAKRGGGSRVVAG